MNCLFFLTPWLLVPLVAHGRPWTENFESFEPGWQIQTPAETQVRIEQQRTEYAGKSGRGELIRLETPVAGTAARLSFSLPSARVLDELTVSLAIRSQHPGWVIALDVVTPAAIDPETGKPMRFLIRGETHEDPGKWVTLTCRTSLVEIQQKLILLRAQHPEIAEFGQLYVDRVSLFGRLPAGTSTLHIDDLEFGPIVAPDPVASVPQVRDSDLTASVVPSVEFRLDRLLVDGRPLFPRIVRYQGESPELLKELGFNVVWIPDVSDSRLIARLWEHGLWTTAIPPRPLNPDGTPQKSVDAGLIPFAADTDPILFWNFGTRIPGESRPELAGWIEQVAFADRRRSRPVAADVAFSEQQFSRDVQMLGISRHPLQTSMTLDDYRLWLQDRRSLARPGSFCWTWLQTEPSPTVVEALRGSATVPTIEPEQIRLQAYAAIAAGCRGLGFWTTSTLEGTTAADVERRLAIRRLNLELQLLEPWLSTSSGAQQISCSATLPEPANVRRNSSFGVGMATAIEREAQLRTRRTDERQRAAMHHELSAYVLRTELGMLILPLWLEGSSQFVPAHGAVADVSLVVPGAERAATVAAFSTTKLWGLRSEQIAGGRKIELPQLDEVAFIWMTSDLALLDLARDRIRGISPTSAEVVVELASRKLERVSAVDQELQGMAPRQPDGPQKLARSRLRLENANSALQAGDHASASALAGEVLQLLRLLQRDHWDAAVEHLSAPTTSPFTLCYQTLPDHWRMLSAFGTSRERPTRNLLPSGEFEDFDTIVAERWGNVHRAPDAIQTSAALFPTGRQKSHYALRLEARPQPGSNPPLVLDEPAVTITTPDLSVSSGQILHISGWVKLSGPISGSRDGLLIYDSILGRNGALRLREGDQWTRFELLRPVPTTGEMTLSLSLTGLGEALIDDLQVIPHEIRSQQLEQPVRDEIQQTSATKRLPRLPKLPFLNPSARESRTEKP